MPTADESSAAGAGCSHTLSITSSTSIRQAAGVQECCWHINQPEARHRGLWHVDDASGNTPLVGMPSFIVSTRPSAARNGACRRNQSAPRADGHRTATWLPRPSSARPRSWLQQIRPAKGVTVSAARGTGARDGPETRSAPAVLFPDASVSAFLQWVCAGPRGGGGRGAQTSPSASHVAYGKAR